ncbi:MAG TPA: aminotransferase class V-fold PLP-dependent enzyme [bacterium]|nr:aminotransferase class V-fold PLP-dependent enzyme [bacterium]
MNRYFDNAATSWPKPACVSQAVIRTFNEAMGNPGRSNNPELNRLPYLTRELLARLLNVRDSSRIAFGHNATHMINIGIRGLVQQGDRVITSSVEHNAVSRPLKYLEKLGIIQVDIVQCSKEGCLDPDDIRAALKQKAALVVINHASNVTGAICSLTEIGRIVRENDSIFMVDCAQSIGAFSIDVERDNIDVLAGPGHKNLLGPTGTGFLYVSPRTNPEPLIFGGTGSRSALDSQPEDMPDCYESGTQNFHGLAGLKAALEYIHSRGIESITHRKRELCRYVLDGLLAIEGLTLYGPRHAENRSPVFSITVRDVDVADIANALLDDHGIITRTGLHCSPWAHKTIGSFPMGTVRLSPGLFHTDEDLDMMLSAVEQTVRKFM